MVLRSRGTIIKQDEKGSIIYCPILPYGDDVKCEVIFYDGKSISPDQRKKIYALLRDISDWSGYPADEAKAAMKYHFIAKTGCEDFSLSDCSCGLARRFIGFLIEFCLIHDIPCRDSLLSLCEDIKRYLYLCLIHKKCCICGKKTQLHHATTVGMGYDRNEICHIGMMAEALCFRHHRECHDIGQKSFDEEYHIFGIEIDGIIAEKYRLKRKEKK